MAELLSNTPGADVAFSYRSKITELIAEFRRYFPDAAAGVPCSARLPRTLFAEALASLVCGRTPGVLKAGMLLDMAPSFRIIQRIGPLYMLELTFPHEKTHRIGLTCTGHM